MQLRIELVHAAQNLGAILDESWRNYLALPRGVFFGDGIPTADSLDQVLLRYEALGKDGRYRPLLDRAEFQQLYGLLQSYAEQVRKATAASTANPSASLGVPGQFR